jgi:hypothetical protein
MVRQGRAAAQATTAQQKQVETARLVPYLFE